MAQEPLQKARALSYNYLSMRARSVHELQQKLKSKEFSDEVIEEVVADFQRLNLLDDRAFARRWVESRMERAAGARKFAFDLRRKGIDAAIIDEVLAEFKAQLNAPERALALLRKQAWRYRGLEREKAQRRMLGFLARRGCDPQAAIAAIGQIWEELQEDEVTGD